MSDGQIANLVITAVVGFLIGFIWIFGGIRYPRWIYFYGGGLMLLGVVGWILMGRHPAQLILFRETAGFGRAFVAGAMMIVSGIVFSIYDAFMKLFKR